MVDEIERTILWRAIVAQERRIVISGPLPSRIEIEPVTSIVSLTRWTKTDAAEIIPAADYMFVSRDPAGTTIAPLDGTNWPAPERSIGSFALTFWAGWEVTGSTNAVPLSIQLMVSRAVEFREGAGLGDIGIGLLKARRGSFLFHRRAPSGNCRHWPRLCLPTGHLLGEAVTMLNDALTARIASTKRRLLKGGLLQPVEWGVPGERDERGRRAFTYSEIEAFIEDRPALDRSAIDTDRTDATVLFIFDPLAITDEHVFRWGDPRLHTYSVKSIDGLVQDEETGVRFSSEVVVN